LAYCVAAIELETRCASPDCRIAKARLIAAATDATANELHWDCCVVAREQPIAAASDLMIGRERLILPARCVAAIEPETRCASPVEPGLPLLPVSAVVAKTRGMVAATASDSAATANER